KRRGDAEQQCHACATEPSRPVAILPAEAVEQRLFELEARCLGNENQVHAACLRPRAAERLSRAASTCRNAAWSVLSDDDGRGGFGFVSSVTSGPSKRVRNLTSNTPSFSPRGVSR